MAYTVEDLQKIQKAIVSGTEEVQLSDKKVKFRSQTELLEIEARIKDELGLSATRPFQSYPSFDKGL